MRILRLCATGKRICAALIMLVLVLVCSDVTASVSAAAAVVDESTAVGTISVAGLAADGLAPGGDHNAGIYVSREVAPTAGFPSAPEIAIGSIALAAAFRSDTAISQSLQAPLPAGVQWVPYAISDLGGEIGMAALHAVIYAQDKELAIRSARAVATATVVTYALKTLIGRARPDASDNPAEFHGLSFSDDRHSMPSGHTTAAFAMARVLADHDPKHAALYYAAATCIGLSRISLERHWPSDVVAGAILGLAIGRNF